MDYEALSEKFQAFLLRATRCQNIFQAELAGNADKVDPANTPHIPSLDTGSQSQGPSTSERCPPSNRRIILLEDLPNILHPKTREKFHLALESFVKSTNPGFAPIVIIVSDAGLRGEASDEKRSQGIGSWGKEVVDIRTVLPPTLLNSTYVTQIG
jgi:cell cycle checkpoint protein